MSRIAGSNEGKLRYRAIFLNGEMLMEDFTDYR